MKKRSKKLLSLFLSAMMVFSVVPATVYAEPAVEENTSEQTAADQEDNTEAVQEDANADTTEATAEETTDKDSSKTEEATTDNGVAAQAAISANSIDTGDNVTIQLPAMQFKGANAALAEALTENVKLDESDPAIKGLRKELESIEVTDSNTGTADQAKAIATYAENEKDH